MYKKITVAAFLVSLLAFFVFTFVLPRDERASELENRPLAEMPELSADAWFSGQFGSLYESYLSDNVGFRSYFTEIGSRFEKALGFTVEDKGQIITLPNGSSLALHDGKIMEIFKKNDTVKASYIAMLNSYADILPDGTEMYLMLVPTQIEFNTSEYRDLADSQHDTISEIYSSASGINTVNVYDSLKAHSGEYVYFRTDHHWTQRGAYLGYEALIKATGNDPVPLTSMEYDSRSGFLGYLYNQANVPEFSQHADKIEFFTPGKNYSVSAEAFENDEIVKYEAKIICPPVGYTAPTYAVFMGGDHAFARVDTDLKNGKTALVIKDSYANALLPFLTNHYETIIILDPRSYDPANFYGPVSELLTKFEVDDLFLINYAFSTTFSEYTACIDKIR